MVHALMDSALVWLTSISMRSKLFFSRTISSPTWTRHRDAVRLTASRTATDQQVELTVQTLVGAADPAYRILQWKGPQYPTLIFHHGHSEAAFDFSERANNTFRHMFFMGQAPLEANWVVVRAAYHNGPLEHYLEHMVHLSHYMAMLAASAQAVEEVVAVCRKRAGMDAKIYVAGVGLGGWVANLHRALYNSATGYIPLLAGTALGDAFVDGYYRRITGALAREYSGQVRELLNFEQLFNAHVARNVFPLLARHDRIVPWKRQSQTYTSHPVHTVSKGHMTALISPKDLRQHILRVMQLSQ